MAHAEDLVEGQGIAQDWQAYLQAVIRPRRWIDGIGILACCETMGVRACVLQKCKRSGELLPTSFFVPEGK
eukprot:1923556-Alexandrium_andersonii.AAC.1